MSEEDADYESIARAITDRVQEVCARMDDPDYSPQVTLHGEDEARIQELEWCRDLLRKNMESKSIAQDVGGHGYFRDASPDDFKEAIRRIARWSGYFYEADCQWEAPHPLHLAELLETGTPPHEEKDTEYQSIARTAVRNALNMMEALRPLSNGEADRVTEFLREAASSLEGETPSMECKSVSRSMVFAVGLLHDYADMLETLGHDAAKVRAEAEALAATECRSVDEGAEGGE